MTERRLRTAVVGTGFVGPHHVDAVRRTGFADVVAIGGSDPGRTAARAAALGVERSTTDLDELLADESIDVVHVCTPNQTHVEIASRVLEAGKHLVLEKPIAIDGAGARALVDLGRRSGKHAAVALTYRGYPQVRAARERIARGELGDLRLVHGTYLQDWLARPTDYNWRLDASIGGPSRAVADIGTHWFDVAEFITGLRVESVVADLATFIATRERPVHQAAAFSTGGGPVERVEVGSEDAATILVRFEGGARGAVVVSQVSPGRKNGFAIEVAGSERSLAWAQEEPELLWLLDLDGARRLQRTPDPDGPTVGVPSLPAGHPEGWGEALRDMLRSFYEAVASGSAPAVDPDDASPYPTLADGARSIAFVEAVLRSAAAGRWERLVPG